MVKRRRGDTGWRGGQIGVLPAAYTTQRSNRHPFATRVIAGREKIGTVSTRYGGAMILTANPAYWTGTYISLQAKQYSQYLPLSIVVEYRPLCPTTTSGIVTFGSKWHNDMPNPELSLLTTPGGHSTAPYAPFRQRIPLRGMSRRMYDMDTALSPDSSPFSFMWILGGSSVDGTVGDIFVTYKYRFFNTNTSPCEYKVDIVPASQVLNSPEFGACSLETLQPLALPDSGENAVPWLSVALNVGTFIAQNYDPIKQIVSWIWKKLKAAEKSRAADAADVAATPDQYVVVYRQEFPTTLKVVEQLDHYYVPSIEEPTFLESSSEATPSTGSPET